MIYQFELTNKRVLSIQNNKAHALYDKNKMGSIIEQGIIELNLYEALFLYEKNKIEIYCRNKLLTFNELVAKFCKINKNFLTNYYVYRDLKGKGHIVKSGLKYGCEFRVYKKGSSLSKGHSKWLCFTFNEHDKFNWYDFSAKNRVAHSTKKLVLIAIVLNENNAVVYYETNWLKL